eukprot:839535-Prymnesium_polylepis.1
MLSCPLPFGGCARSRRRLPRCRPGKGAPAPHELPPTIAIPQPTSTRGAPPKHTAAPRFGALHATMM